MLILDHKQQELSLLADSGRALRALLARELHDSHGGGKARVWINIHENPKMSVSRFATHGDPNPNVSWRQVVASIFVRN